MALYDGPGRAVRAFHICYQDMVVLETEGRAGRLHSMAGLPEGGTSPEHPFLHGVSRDPMHEHSLRQILLASADYDAFLAACVEAGYNVLSAHTDAFDVFDEPVRVRRDGRPVGAAWPIEGQFSCLWWQPEGDAETFSAAQVTAYDRDDAEALYAAAAAAASMEELGELLTARGYQLTG